MNKQVFYCVCVYENEFFHFKCAYKIHCSLKNILLGDYCNPSKKIFVRLCSQSVRHLASSNKEKTKEKRFWTLLSLAKTSSSSYHKKQAIVNCFSLSFENIFSTELANITLRANFNKEQKHFIQYMSFYILELLADINSQFYWSKNHIPFHPSKNRPKYQYSQKVWDISYHLYCWFLCLSL